MKTEKQFEKWIRQQIDKYAIPLGIQINQIDIEKKNVEYLEITCTYPYLDPTIRYSQKAFDHWKEGILTSCRILHELCHIITDPLYCKAISRYVSENEIRDERERLTDTVTAIIRKLI